MENLILEMRIGIIHENKHAKFFLETVYFDNTLQHAYFHSKESLVCEINKILEDL